jgi:methylenetetrahydrofolate reductase (NADPH)
MGSQKNKSRAYSCEFFPPKTDQGKTNLGATIDELGRLKPAYFSCTYGAGGTTQDGTYDTVKAITAKGFVAAPHITCIGSTPEKIKALLDGYIALGIKHIVALRGDLPPGQDQAGHFLYADQLVAFIRQETGKHFHIEIAAYPEKHPEAVSIQQDLLHFKKKANAGADAAITQYFYNPDAYFRFVEDCARQGIHIPIMPGIMPITNYKQLARFSESCGAEIPRWIATRLESYGEDLESIRAFGLDVTRRLCQTLLQGGAPGLHFYTLNRTEPTRTLWEQLGL